MIPLFITAFFLGFSTFAGVSSVGHGGGFAEMKIFEINLQLSGLAQLCLDHSECKKSDLEISALQKIAQLRESSFAVNTTCNSPFVHQAPVDTTVDSCLLYGISLLPKSYSELLEVAMYRRLLRTGLSDFDVFLQQWKSFTLDSLDEELATTPFWIKSKFEQAHVTQVKIDGVIVSQKFYIETQAKTYDITLQVTKEFSCKSLVFVDLPYYEIIGQSQNSVSLRSDVNVVCNSQSVHKRLYLDFKLSQDETLKTNIRALNL